MKETKNKQLIVVLGMHRSGTSAITRGLQVLGVELGDTLLPPVAGVNDKGFWEDIDFNALNIEMLNALGRDWHHIAAIDQHEIDVLRNKGYFLRAVELLRRKGSASSVLGVKDPRVATLLHFWRAVFSHCQFNVGYVLAVRHPLSVVKSLEKRDGLETGESYLLWAAHIIGSLVESQNERRVLVDYDRLMHAPETEIARMANSLQLEIDPAELRRYQADFLDQNLRHTVYELNDLLLDSACPPLVKEMYAELLEVAADRKKIDDPEMLEKFGQWSREFNRIQPSIALLDKCFSRLTAASHDKLAMEAHIAELEKAVGNEQSSYSNAMAERDAEIDSLNQTVAERDGQIAGLNKAVAEREGQIADLNQTVAECEGQITGLNQVVAERDEQIVSIKQEGIKRQAEYQGHVAELEKAVWAEQKRSTLQLADLTDLRQQFYKVLSSRSWRLTAPLRRLLTFAYQVPRKISSWALSTYRALPISPGKKQKLKNLMFVAFGFAFRRLDAYKRWQEYRQIQTVWPSAAPVVPEALSPSTAPRMMPVLQTADGTWEWSDYDAVKSRIAQAKAQQLSQVSPTPLKMIEIGNEPFETVAARVKLPVPPAEPDVSIILPVFNNLKLTLECLLSISAHADSRLSFEIILADDASTDQTQQVVGKIANLRVVRNDLNLGFLRNCNKALEHVRGRYVVYLNNDVQVTQNWLENMHQTFNTYPNVGAVGPRFVYPSGYLQEAGAAFRHDGTADMVGLNDDPNKPRYGYTRRVDYVSGASLMMPTALARQLGGFSEEFLPCYCEDSDLCLRVMDTGYDVYFNPTSVVIHHLSKTTAAFDSDFKLRSIATNLVKLGQKWQGHFDRVSTPRIIAFYLPQFHPFPENDRWWGNGFTEWANVTKAQPNFVGHYQPRLPADLGFYDLRVQEIMQQQVDLAQRYGIYGFCFYYYWFGGKRLLEQPIEQMLASGIPEMPFCLCWANENWTRRWDGQDQEILMAQSHSPEDDEAVINDLIRYFRDPRYIRIDGRPMILVYRVSLFPDFAATVACWRQVCKRQGIGEIYVAMVESMELTHANKHPNEFGCDAAVEFPPQGMAEQTVPSGEVINPEFAGAVADYRDIAVRYATREFPGYPRFKGVMPGWDNTARRQNNSFCFEHATPGAFQAWLEETIEQTRQQHYGDEKLVFVNAWNEWAEGAYLEPDRRFGYTYLEAVKNAAESARLLCRNKYWHGN